MTTQTGESLRQAREEQGRSLDDLAADLGVAPDELAAIERTEPSGAGVARASRRAVLRMYARALGVDPEPMLLDASGEAPPAEPAGSERPAATEETSPAATEERLSAATEETSPAATEATEEITPPAAREATPSAPEEAAPRAAWSVDAPPPTRRPRRRLVIVLALSVLLLLVAGGLAWVGVDLARARTAGLAGQAAVEQAEAHLSRGDVPAAAEELGVAHERFAAARRRLRRPLTQAAATIPVAGRSLRAAEAHADAGALVAGAGQGLLGEVAALPGGPEALAPRDGALPVATIERLAPAVAEAAEDVATARARVEEAPRRLLVPPLPALRDQAETELAALDEGLRRAAAFSEQAPTLLGADEPRRYLFGAQNPAELRGTGGLIGAWTVLTVHHGHFMFGEFDTVGKLTAGDARSVAGPHPEYDTRYGRFGAAGNGSNVNMTPHLPWAAQALLNLHERRPDAEPLDGVVLADPSLVAGMLEATGPVQLPEVGRLAADDAVAYLTNQAYDELDPEQRKATLGDAAVAAFERFLSEADPRAMLRTLGSATDEGHLAAYARDEAAQDALESAGAAGVFDPPEAGDFLAVVLNDASATKLDFYLDEELVYDVELREDGSADVTATVRLTNHAPAAGRSRTVLGPNAEGFEAGENRLFVSTSCAPGCELSTLTRDGDEQPLTAQRERGAPTFSSLMRLARGESTELVYRWRVPDAWQGDRADGTYRLTLHGQPTIRPVEGTVRVHLPEGAQPTHASPELRTEEQVATWHGTVGGGGVSMEIDFATPVREGIWHRVRAWRERS